MIDLAPVTPELFACALESNLRRLGPPRKLDAHFLDALSIRLAADCVWLFRAGYGQQVPQARQLRGDAALYDAELVAAHLRRERPDLPPTVVQSRVTLHGSQVAVVGAARREAPFTHAERRACERLCEVFAAELRHREEERLARVLDRIRGKIVAELRPRDLAYQILDGLHQLVEYDHSSAFLSYEAPAGAFRIEAEKVVWAKAKSAFVGHEIRVSPEAASALSQGIAIRLPGATGAADPAFEVLDYHRDPGVPPVTSVLSAPLFFDGAFLGLLKIASTRRGTFSQGDIAVVERFLPAAAVSMRNAQVNRSLERQAMRAELKAGLVTLASAVAHDVNNAVGSILPLAQQMREELREPELDRATFDRDLGSIIDSARLCQRIFSNMLRVAGAGRSADGPIDLNQVVAETLPFFQGQAARRRVEVKLDLAPDLPSVHASRHDLQHVLLNLVSNSFDAISGRGGRITVSTSLGEGGGVCLAVADNGTGIQPELLAKVQEPFFSTKPGGTGLGLAICRALAWQNGGNLEIRSGENGEGHETWVGVTVGGPRSSARLEAR